MSLVTSRISQGHSLYQLLTFWDYSFLSYAAGKQTHRQTDIQTDKQTEGAERRIHDDRPTDKLGNVLNQLNAMQPTINGVFVYALSTNRRIYKQMLTCCHCTNHVHNFLTNLR